MAAPSADRINARAAKDRAFLKRALKDPGLRSKLDPKYLSAGQRQSRTLNTRLNAPITPGSSTTERDLAHAAQAATTVQFGPQEQALGQQLGVAQQTQRDTGSFYDQYQAQLAHHEQMVQAFQAGAQQGLANTAAGITGLAGQDATQLQGMANQQAAQQGVAPAGDMTQLQNQAAATRQALIGSFQAQQALQGANANDYADTQANVVAPGQKLSALAQAAGRTRDVGQKITDLKGQEGAFNEQFRDTRRQDEFKNVLAQQTLSGNQTIAAANAATNASKVAAQSDPSVAAAKTSATASATQAAKYGYTAHQWALLGPTARAKVIKDAKAVKPGSSSDTRYTSGPFAGRLKSEVNAMSPAQAKKIVDAYSQGKGKPTDPATQAGKDFQRKYGVKPVATGAIQTASNSIQTAQSYVNELKSSGNSRQDTARLLLQGAKVPTTDTNGKKGTKTYPKLKGIWLTVALDNAFLGGISRGTADKLHHLGYPVAQLRLKMATPKKSKPAYKPPASGPAAKVPGVGGN